MVAPIEVLLLVAVEVLVHGDGPDILHRVFVLNQEIVPIFTLQLKAHILNQVAIADDLLPMWRTAIDLGIEHELSQGKEGHGIGDAPIVVTYADTVLVGEVDDTCLELVDSKLEHLCTRRLGDVLHRHLSAGDKRYRTEEVEQVPVVNGTKGTHLGAVVYQFLFAEERLVGLE